MRERLAHIQAAKGSLRTDFTWICDNMTNDLKHSMGDRPNSEFIIDPDGRVIVRRAWSDPEQLREDLAELVGESENVTRIADLGYRIDPQPRQAASGVIERMELSGRMIALKSTLVSSSEGDQLYVKIRAEADEALMDTGKGKLYFAFHIDPIYQVHWNNDSMRVQYELKLPSDMTSNQLNGEGPKVDVPADVDPREFLVDLESRAGTTEPIVITVRSMICDDAESFCIPVTEVFEVILQRDPELGRRRSATGDRNGRPGGRGNNRGGRMQRMMQRDTNKDGKLSKDEVPPGMRERFNEIDKNRDGFLDKSEMESMGNRGRGGRRRDR